ncbi:MAG: mechanosensitive ion channel family protein [Candidatus Promineifilaceae bacterium]
MDGENLEQAEPFIDVLRDQIDFLLAVISRPVLQRQIIAILIILLVTWLLPSALEIVKKRRGAAGGAREDEAAGKSRWLFVLYQVAVPVVALLLLNLSIWLFGQQGYPSGLLAKASNFFWLWLIYRILITFLYTRFGEEFRPVKNRIVIPVFLYLIIRQFASLIPASVALVQSTLSVGSVSFTLGDLIGAFLTFYIFIVIAWIVKEIMIEYGPARLNAEPGLIESVATLTSYALISLGIVLALAVLGVNFASLAIIAGGLSVGIGIGLQDLVANFVSGLVLLFEQSLRPGDVVELDGEISQVKSISLRATTVRTQRNEELIIPNLNFTTEQVKNLTKTERVVRLVIPFGVSYKSDPQQVQEIAVQTALQHSLVLSQPPPILLFGNYGDSSLDFKLAVAVDQPQMSARIRSEIYYMLWQSFKENAIEIPYPQRDLNLGTGWENFTINPAA